MMADETIDELPAEEIEQYNDEQKDAFRATYADALKRFDGDQQRALDVAHAAARGTPGDR